MKRHHFLLGATLSESVTLGRIVAAVLFVMLFVTGCKNDDDDTPAERITIEQVNVDVILPDARRTLWQPVIDLALQNIELAQQGLSKRVELNMRYHDEDAEDLGLTVYSLCYPEEGDDTCDVILGPTRSTKCQMVLGNAAQYRVPVLMPTATSDEIQRIQAERPYSWFFTESDVTQCEVLLGIFGTSHIPHAALLYQDDKYGQSFRNWFGFMATEFQVDVAADDIQVYDFTSDLTAFFKRIEQRAQTSGEATALLMALSSNDDYLRVIRQIKSVRQSLGLNASSSNVMYVVSDTGDNKTVQQAGLPLYGISPCGSPVSGFDVWYKENFGTEAPYGAAQVYDAITTIALGAAKRLSSPTGPDDLTIDGVKVEYREQPFGPNLADWMRALVADKSGTPSSWTKEGLRTAFSLLSEGRNPSVRGCTGRMEFDGKMHTTILHTTYRFWRTKGDGSNYTLTTLSTSSDSGAGALNAWDMEKLFTQDFDTQVEVNHSLPSVTDHWALLLSPSTTWSNYRHQADVLAMYQLLRRHGYDDDHIILVCEDNLATAMENKYPGKVFVESGGEDVRQGAVVDYHFTDLTMDDIRSIVLGEQSERLPKVIRTTASSDLLIFWSGHGADGRGMCWSDGLGSQIFTGERMHDILSELNDRDGYRRVMLAIETCFSGLIGQAIVGLPDVVAITAANTIEPSKADVHDRTLGVFLSNAFSRSFRNTVNENSDIVLRDLYYNLARSTTGSHVTLYNEANYGSVYELTARDFFPR